MVVLLDRGRDYLYFGPDFGIIFRLAAGGEEWGGLNFFSFFFF